MKRGQCLNFSCFLLLSFIFLRPHGEHAPKNKLFEAAIRLAERSKMSAESVEGVGDSQTLVDGVCGEGDGGTGY